MRSKWVNALIRTIVVLVIAHVVLLFLGYFFKADVGWFGMPMIWAHWSDNWMDSILGLALGVAVYLAIYFFFTPDTEQIEEQR